MMLEKNSAFDVVHYFKIEVFYLNPRRRIEVKVWDDMLWNVRIKWDWYFKYRAALYQVQNPKAVIEVTWGNYPASNKRSIEQICKNKLIAKKRKLSTYINKLETYKSSWNSLFEIDQDPIYNQACKKIEKIKNELELALN